MKTSNTVNGMIKQSLRPSRLLLALGLAVCSLPSWAANILKDVEYSTGNGGKVDITFEFAQPVGAVNAFTTGDPPRIAIDFPDTTNGFETRRLAIGAGAASAVSVVEAGGRTRAVVDLFRASGYTTRSNGNQLIVSLEGGGPNASTVAMMDPADPAKRLDAEVAVSALDFRRNEDGSGRIILSFDRAGALADMRNDDGRIVVDVANARLPADQQRRLDVSDFATAVRSIEPAVRNGGTQLVINTEGAVDTRAYQTGNEYVIEVAAKAAPARAAVGQVGAPAPVRYSGRPVTFNFQDVPVRTILQLIAEESNLNIVASDSVEGNLTLRLINVPWDQAMDIVLRAKSLDKRRDGNVVWVAPQKELADFEQAREQARIDLENKTEMVTEYIPINYGNAEAIASLLTEDSKRAQGGGGAAQQSGASGFLSPRGSVSFDARTNTLLLVDIPGKVASIRELVSLLDRPVDQVLIEARIVIASERFSRELGARFGVSGRESDLITSGSIASNRNYTNTLAANQVLVDNYNRQLADFNAGLTTNRPAFPSLATPSFTNILNANVPVAASAGAVAFTILGENLDLDIELSALQEEGRGEVVANPRVITANQREAVIKQGDEIGYVTTRESNGAVSQTVEFKEALLELKVTPTITQDGRVFLVLGVKKDELAGFVSTVAGDVPQITKREVNTAVLIDNGQTVVIGGVYEFAKREDLSKVPFLGDIPGIGNLFRNRNRTNDKAELLIFVTPRILEVTGAGTRN